MSSFQSHLAALQAKIQAKTGAPIPGNLLASGNQLAGKTSAAQIQQMLTGGQQNYFAAPTQAPPSNPNTFYGTGLSALATAPWGTAPSTEGNFTTRDVRWAHGPYSVGYLDKHYYLSRVSREGGRIDLYAGSLPPSRALLAAVIRWDRGHRPRVNARDEFGSLLGVRYFRITDSLHLQSPSQGTIWDSAVLNAVGWSDDNAVRGSVGIHAAWPAMGANSFPVIDAGGQVIARVRGQGKYVMGKEGWRAERVIVDTVYLPHALKTASRVRRMEALYPSIAFEDESWTLER